MNATQNLIPIAPKKDFLERLSSTSSINAVAELIWNGLDAGDERFNGVPATWKFVAVSNEMNDYARQDSNQEGRPRGQVWSSPDGKVTVWVREWAEVIHTARARLDFINETLAYEADRESAREYLTKAHSKFIPDVEEGGKECDEGLDDAGAAESVEV